MKARLIGVYAANLFDLAATLFFVGLYGLGAELNPFGAALLGRPAAAVIYKTLIVGALLLVLWRFRREKLARIGSAALLAGYSALAAYHIILLALVAGV